MTQEEKELLFSDLCSRLPLGIYAEITYGGGYKKFIITDKIKKVTALFNENVGTVETEEGHNRFIEYVKPYLRPLSDMSNAEKEELFQLMGHGNDAQRIDFYIKHFLDYKNLIPMNLAIQATENMYKHD